MGTIGDRLGADLAALFGGEGEASPKSNAAEEDLASAPSADETGPRGEGGRDAAGEPGFAGVSGEPGSARKSGAAGESGASIGGVEDSRDSGVHTSEVEDAAVASGDSLEVLLRETIAELSGKDAGAISLEDDLEDLDIVGLSLWAVVAELERSLKVEFLDADVLEWETPAQIIEASEALAS